MVGHTISKGFISVTKYINDNKNKKIIYANIHAYKLCMHTYIYLYEYTCVCVDIYIHREHS